MTPLVIAALVLAQPGPPAKVRTSLGTKGDVWVGQRVTLVVELLAPGTFAGAPAFDLPAVPGVLILKPEDRPTLGTEDADGTTYTVQRHEFAVYPQRAGAVTIPAFPVRFESSAGFGRPTTPQRVTTIPVTFTAKRPPGTDGLATVVTTRDLTVKEDWKPEPGPAKVGAAFTRTITVEARDVPGMALPAFRCDPPDGLRAYPKPPAVEDHVERGDLTGRRVETETYVCEKAGKYTIPAFSLAWWDPDDQTVKQARLPGRVFEVSAPPEPTAPAATPAPPSPRRTWEWVVGGLAVLTAVAAAAWRPGPAILARWRRHRQATAESEAAYFAAFRRACQSGDAPAVHRALLAWLYRFVPDGPATIDEFAARAGDPELADRLTSLQAVVFGPPACRANWSADGLDRRVAAARSRLLGAARGPVARAALPPLNPAGPTGRVSTTD
jgi:hypothetical protein